MKCPSCGYKRQAKDDDFVPENECPSCGIDYGDQADAFSESNPLRSPSPVSASSLKKARERVERRLRQRQLEQHRDSRHAQTLELARRLTAEGVQKRRAEVEKRKKEQMGKVEQTAAQTPSHEQEDDSQTSSAHSPQPMEEVNRSAKTIAKALKKKRGEPQSRVAKPHDDTAAPDPSPENEMADETATEHKTPSSKENVNAMNESRDASVRSESHVSAATVPREPAKLFQNKPAAPEAGSAKPSTPKEMFGDFDQPLSEEISDIKSLKTKRGANKKGLTQLLPIVAWLILGAGVFGCILSWTSMGNIGHVQAGVQNSALAGSRSLPLGLLLGFAYLATGVLGFAFFWVSSLISRQLKDIHRLLLLQPWSQVEHKEARRV